jgi:DNA mismatch repair protein MSH4
MVAGQAWCEPRLEDDAWQREARIKGVTTASLLENRAREIGIAIWDPSSLTIKLAQWAESGRSAATCSLLLSLYDVHDTILVDGSARRGHSGRQGASEAPISASLQAITASLPGTQFLLPRAAFDDTKGLLALERVSTPDTWSKVSRARQASSSHGSSAGLYLAFGAAGALLDYLQSHAQQALLSGSLRLEIVGTSAHLQLDAGGSGSPA